MNDIERKMAGYRSKAVGDLFENMISASCDYYRRLGIAIIEKTPEPMRIIKPYGDRRKGQYIACFKKQAQPDYKGTLCDGQAIIFEAKHTDKDRIKEAVITETQRKILDEFEKMGARCFVMVSIKFEKFYRIPWKIFRDMKSKFGRKYMNLDELQPYILHVKNGTILMLEEIELFDKESAGNEKKSSSFNML